jgi:hypothetical protein
LSDTMANDGVQERRTCGAKVQVQRPNGAGSYCQRSTAAEDTGTREAKAGAMLRDGRLTLDADVTLGAAVEDVPLVSPT